jgi:hypothetical protein
LGELVGAYGSLLGDEIAIADTHRHVGDGNFHAALIFKKDVPGEFEKVDEAAHRVS